MEVKTIRDLIDWTRRYHQSLQRCYAENSESSDSERIKLLLDYFATHEAELVQTYKRVMESQDEKVLDSWCAEYSTRQPKFAEDMQQPDLRGLSADKITEKVVEAHKSLIDLYSELAGQAHIDQAHELFSSLLELEEHQLMREMVSVNRFQDM